MSADFELAAELLEVLRTGTDRLRHEAVLAVGLIADSSLSNHLLEILKHEKDARIRASVLKILGRIGSSRVREGIAGYLRDGDPRIRSNAIEALGEARDGGPDVAAVIRPLLEDPNNRVVGTAIKVLHDLGDRTGIETLSRLLRGDDNRHRCSAIWAVMTIRYLPELPTVVEYLGSPVYRVHAIASRCVAAFGSEATPILLDRLTRAHGVRRIFIALSLGQVGDARAVPALIEVLDGAEPEAVPWILEALSRCGGSEGIPRIHGILLRGAPEHRIEALKAFGRLDARSETPVIQALLGRESDPRVLSTAISTLARIGDVSMAPRLRAFLDHPDERVRANAIEAIGVLGDAGIVQELEPFLRSESGRAVANAAIALAPYGDIRLVDVLRDRLRTGDERIRLSVVHALGEISLDGVVEALVGAVRDESRAVRRMALASLLKQSSPAAAGNPGPGELPAPDEESASRGDRTRAALARSIESDPALLREPGVARILGRLGVHEALEPLLEIVAEPDPRSAVPGGSVEDRMTWLRRDLDALSVPLPGVGIFDPAFVRSLRDLLGSDQPHVRCFALHLIGERSLGTLLGSVVCLLLDEDDRVREQALRTLVALDDPRCLPFVRPRVVEASPRVQRAWLALMARMGTARDTADLESGASRFGPELAGDLDRTLDAIRSRP